MVTGDKHGLSDDETSGVRGDLLPLKKARVGESIVTRPVIDNVRGVIAYILYGAVHFYSVNVVLPPTAARQRQPGAKRFIYSVDWPRG